MDEMRTKLTKRIKSIQGDLHRLDNTLYSLEEVASQWDLEQYEKLSFDAAHRGEVLALRLRNLIYYVVPAPRKEYLDTAEELLGIEIKYQDGIMEVTLPCMLPKKKKWESCHLVLDPFQNALMRYVESGNTPKFRNCVVCCVHVYDRELPARRVRDYDNLEQKKFLDNLALFLMFDDNGKLCELFNTTEFGDADRTIFYLMECDRFPEWYIERKRKLTEIGGI